MLLKLCGVDIEKNQCKSFGFVSILLSSKYNRTPFQHCRHFIRRYSLYVYECELLKSCSVDHTEDETKCVPSTEPRKDLINARRCKG